MLSFFWIWFLMRGDVHPNWAFLPLLLPILLQLGCLGLGTGIIVSSLTTKYRDLTFLVGFGVQLWMYGTPVVYPMEQIESPLLRTVIHINPVTQGVETFRYIIMGKGEVSLFWWGVSTAVTIFVLAAGVLLFNQVEKTFMDTV
jgi:lipopolysaccharide transport system permease protein